MRKDFNRLSAFSFSSIDALLIDFGQFLSLDECLEESHYITNSLLIKLLANNQLADSRRTRSLMFCRTFPELCKILIPLVGSFPINRLNNKLIEEQLIHI